MPQNLISLQEAVNRIKSSIEEAIVSGGTTAKNNLIRSQQPIKLLHEVVKSELIRNGVNEQYIDPPLGESAGDRIYCKSITIDLERADSLDIYPLKTD